MKKGKHTREKFKIIEVYSVLIFIVTLFMSIGYAEISDVLFNITGTLQATSQEGVFITNISNTSEETTSSKINYFIGTMFESQTVLGDTEDSTTTYEVTIYNNSDKEYVYIGALTDTTDGTLYDNENIEFVVAGIEQYKTTIAPTQSLKLTITFQYKDGADLSKNTLNSKINFRFKELPKLVLSNENQTYTLNDIYPDYTPQEYEFTVSNYYSETEINAVPMTYTLAATIDSPLTAKIYDANGQEVGESITIAGDGQTKISNTYKLKIIWDNSASSKYNASEHAGKEFKCNVVLTAKPTDEKYLQYTLDKQFNVSGKTATFNLDANTTSTSITIKNDTATLPITVSNYSSDTDYNKFDTTYEISIKDNTEFSFNSESSITKTLTGNSKLDDNINLELTADMSNLETTENVTLQIASKSPYVTEVTEITISVKLHSVKVTLNANGGTVGTTSITVYQSKVYTGLPTPTRPGYTFNGWYSATSGGTKYTTSTEVTTDSSTQTLYAQWTPIYLADKVEVGEWVNYPVEYSNVLTTSDDSYYTGWRVLSVNTTTKVVRLVSGGLPLTYRHPATTSSGPTSVKALTTNFLSTEITSSDNYTFNSCGFTDIGSDTNLAGVFDNNYTTNVQSMTKDDIDEIYGSTTGNVTYLTNYELLVIEGDGDYVPYHVADYTTLNSYHYLWNVYQSGAIIYTNSEHGIRPVVTLDASVVTTGQDSTDVWQIGL